MGKEKPADTDQNLRAKESFVQHFSPGVKCGGGNAQNPPEAFLRRPPGEAPTAQWLALS